MLPIEVLKGSIKVDDEVSFNNIKLGKILISDKYPFGLIKFKDESFDFAISEYGASIWCDPYRWIPEAARVLRPGGQLVILENSIVLVLCQDWEQETVAGEELLQPQFGMHRFEDLADNSVEFHISHGEKIQLFRSCGFEIEELIELQPPEESDETRYAFVDLTWANKWPAEEAWIVRKK